MSEIQTRSAIETALKKFARKPLADAAIHFFETLGYSSQKRLKLTPNTRDQFLVTFAKGKALNNRYALPDEWKSIDFLFQLTDDEIRTASGEQLLPFASKGKWDGAVIESYLFLAIDLKGGHYSRTALAGITRELNKLFAMPAFVLFRHGNYLTFAIINRRLHKRDDAKDVLEKVTLIKDIQYSNTHRAHIEILLELSLGALHDKHTFSNFVELQRAWQQTLSLSALNKRFYQQIANWYFWAIHHVEFPRPPEFSDEDGYRQQSVIRR